jgi:CspA family cold shock protein
MRRAFPVPLRDAPRQYMRLFAIARNDGVGRDASTGVPAWRTTQGEAFSGRAAADCIRTKTGAIFARDLRLGLSFIRARHPGDPCKHSTATRLFVAAPDLRAAFAFWRSVMTIGTVKFFNATKGFGFIAPEGGEKDVFVHVSAVEKSGLGTLAEGQRISFDVVTERGKLAASNLKAA